MLPSAGASSLLPGLRVPLLRSSSDLCSPEVPLRGAAGVADTPPPSPISFLVPPSQGAARCPPVPSPATPRVPGPSRLCKGCVPARLLGAACEPPSCPIRLPGLQSSRASPALPRHGTRHPGRGGFGRSQSCGGIRTHRSSRGPVAVVVCRGSPAPRAAELALAESRRAWMQAGAGGCAEPSPAPTSPSRSPCWAPTRPSRPQHLAHTQPVPMSGREDDEREGQRWLQRAGGDEITQLSHSGVAGQLPTMAAPVPSVPSLPARRSLAQPVSGAGWDEDEDGMELMMGWGRGQGQGWGWGGRQGVGWSVCARPAQPRCPALLGETWDPQLSRDPVRGSPMPRHPPRPGDGPGAQLWQLRLTWPGAGLSRVRVPKPPSTPRPAPCPQPPSSRPGSLQFSDVAVKEKIPKQN